LKTIFVVGTAGSGKSTFTSALSEWLKDNEQSVVTVNLDPAVTALPYEPDIDVRDIVDYERIVAVRGLGPNAALIASVREIARNVEEISDQIDDFSADYAIVDTPGQLELFAFRKEGKIIADNLARKERGVTYLLDPILAATTRNFASLLFLTTSVYLSLAMPLILVITKIDAVPKKYLNRLSSWLNSADDFELDVENRSSGVQMLITREVARLVYEIGQTFPAIMVSSKTMEGMMNLHAALTRTLGEGEDELR